MEVAVPRHSRNAGCIKHRLSHPPSSASVASECCLDGRLEQWSTNSAHNGAVLSKFKKEAAPSRPLSARLLLIRNAVTCDPEVEYELEGLSHSSPTC
mmetsp:Transcript_893/g.1731  ORF Transcript_893/g.1731 Transcript_893/m.1731 type:complete len:97 (+) Transcript_893:679-969(+)